MKKIKLVTHSGRFHADDVFATAVLSLLFEKQKKEFELIRSRKPEDIEEGDIVYDNGRQYDFENKIFDHHQEGGAGERENNVPYAAFGLIWKHYGEELVNELFKKNIEDDEISNDDLKKIWQLVDESIVQPIDASDTGYEDFQSDKKDLRTYVMDSFVKDFNPTSDEDYEKSYELFMESVSIAKRVLSRKIISTKSKVKALKKVREIYESTEDKRIIILEEGGSWKEFLIDKPEPLYVIFPTSDSDGWMVQGVNTKPTGYDLRKSFPENWCGKSAEELEKEIGIEGVKFCHLKGFLCVTKTKEQAIELANVAVEK
jgi:uncharacterized UPF0160 family protein